MAQLYELSFVYQNKKQTAKILPQNFQMIIFWAAVSKFCPLSHSQSQIPIVNLENREFTKLHPKIIKLLFWNFHWGQYVSVSHLDSVNPFLLQREKILEIK